MRRSFLFIATVSLTASLSIGCYAQEHATADTTQMSREEWQAHVKASRERLGLMRRERKSLVAPPPTQDEMAEAASRRVLEDDLRPGDIVVVAQKIVSKTEGRLVRLADVVPGEVARQLAATTGREPAMAQLVLDESSELLRTSPAAIIARHKTGHVLANAGIDASNVEGGDGGTVLLWPRDPDASARPRNCPPTTRMGRLLVARLEVALAVIAALGTARRAVAIDFGLVARARFVAAGADQMLAKLAHPPPQLQRPLQSRACRCMQRRSVLARRPAYGAAMALARVA